MKFLSLVEKINSFMKKYYKTEDISTHFMYDIDYTHNNKKVIRINSFLNDNTNMFLFKILIDLKSFKIFGIEYKTYTIDSLHNEINQTNSLTHNSYNDSYLSKFDMQLSQLLIDDIVQI